MDPHRYTKKYFLVAPHGMKLKPLSNGEQVEPNVKLLPVKYKKGRQTLYAMHTVVTFMVAIEAELRVVAQATTEGAFSNQLANLELTDSEDYED
jgi:hypothetical protein